MRDPASSYAGSFNKKDFPSMNRNGLFMVIGALIVVVAGLGYYVYKEESKPSGVEIKIGEGGVSVEEN